MSKPKTKTAPKKKEQVAQKRSFVLIAKNGSEYGRYMNKNPAQAAIKAAKPFLVNKVKVNVTIRESTQGSKKKEYNYTVSKKKISDRKSKELKKTIGFEPKFNYNVKAN